MGSGAKVINTILGKRKASILRDFSRRTAMPFFLLGGQPGHAVVYNLMSDGAEYKVLIAWAVHGDKAYIFTYNAPVNRYEEFAKDASTIIGSLSVV
jgi:hypothetical protein